MATNGMPNSPNGPPLDGRPDEPEDGESAPEDAERHEVPVGPREALRRVRPPRPLDALVAGEVALDRGQGRRICVGQRPGGVHGAPLSRKKRTQFCVRLHGEQSLELVLELRLRAMSPWA